MIRFVDLITLERSIYVQHLSYLDLWNLPSYSPLARGHTCGPFTDTSHSAMLLGQAPVPFSQLPKRNGDNNFTCPEVRTSETGR